MCLYDKQNNTRLFADTDLFFSCSTRYQEIMTVYIILLETSLVRCSHSWDSELNTRREIPYQRAVMYYSLYIEWGQNGRFCHTASCIIPKKLPYSTNFNACLWLDRSVIGCHTALKPSAADHRKSCRWM